MREHFCIVVLCTRALENRLSRVDQVVFSDSFNRRTVNDGSSIEKISSGILGLVVIRSMKIIPNITFGFCELL